MRRKDAAALLALIHPDAMHWPCREVLPVGKDTLERGVARRFSIVDFELTRRGTRRVGDVGLATFTVATARETAEGPVAMPPELISHA